MNDIEKILAQIKNDNEGSKMVFNKILKHDFTSFLKKAFDEVDQSNQYIHNWHIDLLCQSLEEAYHGNIKRIVVNMPPRYLKSVIISVAWPAWILGNDPSAKIIAASYSHQLSLKHSLDCRRIISSKWFGEIFPEFQFAKDQNEKRKFSTTKNGYRFATSVGGSVIGEGGNFLILDDPHNTTDLHSKAKMNKTIEWFKNSFLTRINDKKKAIVVVVMQRLHENDLTAYILKNMKNWHHINLPIISEDDSLIKFNKFEKYRKKGDILHEKRDGLEEINDLKNEIGTYIFNAQYQQNPISTSNSMVNQEWFMRYDYDEKICFNHVYLSFDTGIKIAESNDPTVCTIWSESENKFYLLEVVRQWLDYPMLKKISKNLIQKWMPEAVLIEDKASGQSLIQDLQSDNDLSGFVIIPIKVTKDKITRFASVTTLIESRKIYIPHNAPWLADFEHEIYNFPNGKNDDQVDSVSQFLQWIKNKPKIKVNSAVRRI